jgi:predicted TIM-barrel fold metal-dependent hydrolase
MVIDTHMHAWSLDWDRYPFAPPEPAMPRPEHPNATEEVVEVMDRHGTDFTVLVQVRYYGWDNSYINYSLHKYPDLFVAHGLLEPENPNAPERLRYWIKEQGFQGMRFSPIYHPKSTWL